MNQANHTCKNYLRFFKLYFLDMRLFDRVLSSSTTSWWNGDSRSFQTNVHSLHSDQFCLKGYLSKEIVARFGLSLTQILGETFARCLLRRHIYPF